MASFLIITKLLLAALWIMNGRQATMGTQAMVVMEDGRQPRCQREVNWSLLSFDIPNG